MKLTAKKYNRRTHIINYETHKIYQCIQKSHEILIQTPLKMEVVITNETIKKQIFKGSKNIYQNKEIMYMNLIFSNKKSIKKMK